MIYEKLVSLNKNFMEKEKQLQEEIDNLDSQMSILTENTYVLNVQLPSYEQKYIYKTCNSKINQFWKSCIEKSSLH